MGVSVPANPARPADKTNTTLNLALPIVVAGLGMEYGNLIGFNYVVGGATGAALGAALSPTANETVHYENAPVLGRAQKGLAAFVLATAGLAIAASSGVESLLESGSSFASSAAAVAPAGVVNLVIDRIMRHNYNLMAYDPKEE